ncbi:bcl-2-binding component 3 [Synchiropus picturatus]
MARAETIENVGEATIGINRRLQQRCHMDLPVGSDRACPGLLAASSPLSGTCRGSPAPRLRSLEGLSQSLSQASPPNEEQPKHLHPPSGPLNLPPSDGVMDPASAFSPERTGPCRLGPLPDLLPQTEHPPAPAQAREQSVRRVAIQLRTIGDQFHAAVVRERGAPYWPDVEEACRGLLNFLTQTLRALCRLM